MDTKTCTKCGETKPLDEFYRDRAARDGRKSYCKRCREEQRGSPRQIEQRAERARQVAQGVRICTRCGVEKSVDEYYPAKRSRDGSASRCKECCREARRVATAMKNPAAAATRELRAARIASGVKACTVCGVVREMAAFGRNSSGGPKSQCRECDRAYAAGRRTDPEYREEMRRYAHRRYSDPNTREHLRAISRRCQRRRRAENPDEVRAYERAWSAKCRSDPEYREKINAKVREYRKRPHVMEQRREYRRAYQLARYHSDVRFRLRTRMSAGCRAGLRKRGGLKAGQKFFATVPYTVDELRAHLESQFQPGMTWDNMGDNGWEIDHIIPDAAFNYSSTTDLDYRRCWALSNLQPLWWRENRIKSDNLVDPFQPSLRLST